MFEGVPVEKLTAPVLLGIAILMLLMGWLVPRRTYKDKQDESERWRMAYETEQEARRTSDAQTTELLEVARTTHALIVAFFGNKDLLRSTGGKDVAS
jgi:hypothetical protein